MLGTAPGGSWERVTILGAMSLDGILAAMSIAAATDGEVFHAYLKQVLRPELRQVKPDAVLTTSTPTKQPPSVPCWTMPASPTVICRATRRT